MKWIVSNSHSNSLQSSCKKTNWSFLSNCMLHTEFYRLCTEQAKVLKSRNVKLHNNV